VVRSSHGTDAPTWLEDKKCPHRETVSKMTPCWHGFVTHPCRAWCRRIPSFVHNEAHAWVEVFDGSPRTPYSPRTLRRPGSVCQPAYANPSAICPQSTVVCRGDQQSVESGERHSVPQTAARASGSRAFCSKAKKERLGTRREVTEKSLLDSDNAFG